MLAHELGHARLHTKYGYYLHADMSYYVPSKREKEANEFAIHLLSYSSDLDANLINKVINGDKLDSSYGQPGEKNPNPREVHRILSKLI